MKSVKGISAFGYSVICVVGFFLTQCVVAKCNMDKWYSVHNKTGATIRVGCTSTPEKTLFPGDSFTIQSYTWHANPGGSACWGYWDTPNCTIHQDHDNFQAAQPRCKGFRQPMLPMSEQNVVARHRNAYVYLAPIGDIKSNDCHFEVKSQ